MDNKASSSPSKKGSSSSSTRLTLQLHKSILSSNNHREQHKIQPLSELRQKVYKLTQNNLHAKLLKKRQSEPRIAIKPVPSDSKPSSNCCLTGSLTNRENSLSKQNCSKDLKPSDRPHNHPVSQRIMTQPVPSISPQRSFYKTLKGLKSESHREKVDQGDNVPIIDIEQVKTGKNKDYQSAPQSIDRYEFYADNFSLSRLHPEARHNRSHKSLSKELKTVPNLTVETSPDMKSCMARTSNFLQVNRSDAFSFFLDQNFWSSHSQRSRVSIESPKDSARSKASEGKGNNEEVVSSRSKENLSVQKKEIVRTEGNCSSARAESNKSVQRNVRPGSEEGLRNGKCIMKRNTKSLKDLNDKTKTLNSVRGSPGHRKSEKSLSKDKNTLLAPGSKTYGRFGEVYKGLENKSSWKFSMDRFKKLQRSSISKEIHAKVLEKDQAFKKQNLHVKSKASVSSTAVVAAAVGKKQEDSELVSDKDGETLLSTCKKEDEAQEEDGTIESLRDLCDLKSKGLFEWCMQNGYKVALYGDLEKIKKEVNRLAESLGNMNRSRIEDQLISWINGTVGKMSKFKEEKERGVNRSSLLKSKVT